MKSLLPFLALLSFTLAAAAQTPYHRPPGMPEDTLVAFDDFQKPSGEQLTQELLAVSSFRWMLQIPQQAIMGSIRLSLVNEKGELIKEVSRLSFPLIPIAPSKRKTRPLFFPVELHLMPETTMSKFPWRDSKEVLILLKASDLNVQVREICTNPFRRSRQGIGIMQTSRLAVPLKLEPGAWDGFGTGFDIMEDNHTRHRLRVTFEDTRSLTIQ